MGEYPGLPLWLKQTSQSKKPMDVANTEHSQHLTAKSRLEKGGRRVEMEGKQKISSIVHFGF